MTNNLHFLSLRLSGTLSLALPIFLGTGLAAVYASGSDDWGKWSIDINGVSRHSESRYVEGTQSRKFNEDNIGLGASVEWLRWRRMVRQSVWGRWIDERGIDVDLKFGSFDNSYDETSLYVGPFFHKDIGSNKWKFAPGLGLFAVTGYDDTPEDAPPIFPLPVFGLEFGHEAVKFNLGYVPWGNVDFFTLQLQVTPAGW